MYASEKEGMSEEKSQEKSQEKVKRKVNRISMLPWENRAASPGRYKGGAFLREIGSIWVLIGSIGS